MAWKEGPRRRCTMKRKAVLKLIPSPPSEGGWVVTVQSTQGILVLNCWQDMALAGRYCMNMQTMEYASYMERTGTWRESRLAGLLEGEGYGGWYSYHAISQDVKFGSCEDKAAAISALEARRPHVRDPIVCIGELETEYSTDRRTQKECRRVQRIREKMAKVPPMPEELGTWIHQTAASGQDYAFFDKEAGNWSCTACGGCFGEGGIRLGKRIRHGSWLECPECHKKIQAKKRTRRVALVTGVLLLQDAGPDMGVARHIDARIEWEGGRRTVRISEAVRLLLLRKPGRYHCELYYNQMPKSRWGDWGEAFDDRNPANRRTPEAYLYPGSQIMQALSGTAYEPWGRLFSQMAEAGARLDYNHLMAAGGEQIRNAVELLFKGRFFRLLEDTARKISIYSGSYYGILDMQGAGIEEVFGLRDRQKVNRIRDCDGGEDVLRWLRWSEETGSRIDQETLEWMAAQKVEARDLSFILDRMSPRQAMNYVRRQRKEQYPDRSHKGAITQWEDYLSMCGQLGSDLEDEMVYRPRELKRRHDEAVEEVRRQRMMEQMKRDRKANAQAAREMREKYPGAEAILREIAPKYEYQDGGYRIIVPRRLRQIADEGSALHHCAGASERYYERIMQRETYICFLRRVSEPKVPYYTIEIEPGGTIRQHRSHYDEEPGIEEIRGFLRKWQGVIRKRLTEEDRRLARESAARREKNLEELKENNNTRVLKGLEEDFMEAI